MYVGRFVGADRLSAWLASGLMPAEEELFALVEGVLLDGSGNRVARQGITQCACLTDTALHFWLPEEGRCLSLSLRSVMGAGRTALDQFHEEIIVAYNPAETRTEPGLSLRFTLLPREDAALLDRLLAISIAAAHRYQVLGLSPQEAARQMRQVMIKLLSTEVPPADAARTSDYLHGQLRRAPASERDRETQPDDPLTHLLTLFLAPGLKVLRQAWQAALGEGKTLLYFDRQALHELTLALQALNSLVGTVAQDKEVRQLVASFLAVWAAAGRQEAGREAAPASGEPEDDPREAMQDWLSNYAAGLEGQKGTPPESPPAPKSIPLGRRKAPQAENPAAPPPTVSPGSAQNGV